MGSGPTELAGYRLVRRIAIGGMAEVFRAERISDGAPVAIKLLLPQHARDPEFVRMLADEARLQGSLVHPNLVRVLELGRAGKRPFIALELVDGAALRDVLRAGPLPPRAAVHVVAEIVAALEVVHAAGVIHRDVTPENVLCARTGEIRLGDFGIARSAIIGGRTRTGVVKGKLAYLSPEQVKGETVDGRSDLYAAGLVLFEAVTGEPFLRGGSELELLRAAEAPVFRPTGDAGIDAVLAAVLAVDPGARPQTARDLAARLAELGPDPTGLVERIEAAARAAADDDEPRPGTVRVAARPQRRWSARLALPIAGAIAVAAAIAGVVVVRGSSGRATPDAGGPTDAAVTGPPFDAAAPGAPIDAPAAIAASIDAGATAPLGATAAADAGRRPAAGDASGAGADRDAATARPRAADATPAARADAGDATPDPAVTKRLADLRADLRGRGILDADLDAAAGAAIARVETAPTAADGRAALTDAERVLGAIQVDEAFVRAKLERTSAAIRRADRGTVDVDALDKLAAAALDDLLDHRYAECNRGLNEIAKVLAQARQ